MTVIAAYYDEHRGECWMGADTVSWVDGLTVRSQPKVDVKGYALVGVCGLSVTHRALRTFGPLGPLGLAQCGWPARRASGEPVSLTGDLHAQMYAEALSSHWLEWMRERGHEQTSDKGLRSVPGQMLLGTPWGLWRIGGAGDVVRVVEPYAAIGAGCLVAMGALHACHITGVSRHTAVGLAVQAAALHDDQCGGGCEVWSTDATKPIAVAHRPQTTVRLGDGCDEQG